MSLFLWRTHGKMSVKPSETVSQLVKDYREKLLGEPRNIIRRLIIGELSELFENNPSNLRILDRQLKKALQKQNINSIRQDFVTESQKQKLGELDDMKKFFYDLNREPRAGLLNNAYRELRAHEFMQKLARMRRKVLEDT